MKCRLLGLVLLLGGCRTGGADGGGAATPFADPSAEGSPIEYPGTLVEMSELDRDFLMRQKLDVSWLALKFSFEAVVQKQGDVLTVIGMTPFGTKAFVLTQTGTVVEFEKLIDRDMPFPPEYILQDITRAFFYDVELPWGLVGADGGNATEIHEENVQDVYEDGALTLRTFTRTSGEPAGEIRIEYEGGMKSGVPPKRLVFENGWFGYRLEIKTVQYQPL
jgi:hypothetical protein